MFANAPENSCFAAAHSTTPTEPVCWDDGYRPLTQTEVELFIQEIFEALNNE